MNEIRERFAVLTRASFNALKEGDEIWALPEGEEPSTEAQYRKGVVSELDRDGRGVAVVLDSPPPGGPQSFTVKSPVRLARLTDGYVPRRQDWLNERRPHP